MSSPYVDVPKRDEIKKDKPFSYLTWIIQGKSPELLPSNLKHLAENNLIKSTDKKEENLEKIEETKDDLKEEKSEESNEEKSEESNQEIFEMSNDDEEIESSHDDDAVDCDSDCCDELDEVDSNDGIVVYDMDNVNKSNVCDDLKYFTHNFSTHLYNDFVNLPDVVHFYLGFFGSIFLGYGEKFIIALFLTIFYEKIRESNKKNILKKELDNFIAKREKWVRDNDKEQEEIELIEMEKHDKYLGSHKITDYYKSDKQV